MATQTGAALVPLELTFTPTGWRIEYHREIAMPSSGRLRERVTAGIDQLARMGMIDGSQCKYGTRRGSTRAPGARTGPSSTGGTRSANTGACRTRTGRSGGAGRPRGSGRRGSGRGRGPRRRGPSRP